MQYLYKISRDLTVRWISDFRYYSYRFLSNVLVLLIVEILDIHSVHILHGSNNIVNICAIGSQMNIVSRVSYFIHFTYIW